MAFDKDTRRRKVSFFQVWDLNELTSSTYFPALRVSDCDPVLIGASLFHRKHEKVNKPRIEDLLITFWSYRKCVSLANLIGRNTIVAKIRRPDIKDSLFSSVRLV